MKAENKTKQMPKFRGEDEERAFWEGHDSAEFIDWSGARRVVFPELKPTMKTISLRLPGSMLAELKLLANKKDVPYQSLMKVYLSERIQQELKPACEKAPVDLVVYKLDRKPDKERKISSPKEKYSTTKTTT